MAAIFISHSSLDHDAALDLQALLRNIGFQEIFLDFDDRQGIPLGSEWERQLYYNIERCHAMLVVMTSNWLASKWCFAEFAQARALGKLIYVILERPPSDNRDVAKDIQVCDFLSNRQLGLQRLHDELSRSLLLAQEGFPFDETQRSPFPGFNAFEEQDAGIFFGRDAEINAVMEKVKSGSRRSKKTLVLLGGSGSGKSSLLKAGVCMRLRRERDIEGKPVFLVATLRPGALPMRAVLTALRTIDPTLAPTDLDAVLDAQSGFHLIDRLRARAGAPEAMVVLAIDQAEEAFSADAADLEAFVKFLLRLIAEDNPLKLICSLRTDHLEAAQKLEEWAATFEHFNVQPLALDKIGEVITGPARRVDITVDPKLIDAIRGDAVTSDAMPLVAFMLRRLYETYGRAAKRMEAAQYLAMRQGELSPLEAAVRTVADEALQGSSAPQLEQLRAAFVPGLTRYDEQLGVFARKEALRKDLPPDSLRLIDLLIDARLLVQRATPAGTVVEVAHEALYRVWPRLVSWLDADRDILIRFQGFQRAAKDWSANGRAASWLVHRDARLKDLQKLAGREDISARFEPDDRAYLSACETLEKTEREREEAAAREREAARLRELEDAKRLAEAEKVKRRIAVAGAVAVSLFALAALVSLGYAWNQWTLAQQRWTVAQSRLLVAMSATSLQAGELRKAAAQAHEAYDVAEAPETRSALFTALLRLSPDLDAAKNLTDLGTATALAWIAPDSLAIGFSDGRIAQLRATPGEKLTQVAVRNAETSGFPEGRPSAVAALRALADGRLLALYQNGFAAIFTMSEPTARVLRVAPSDAESEAQVEGSPAVSRDGSLIAYVSPSGSRVALCAFSAGTEKAPACKTLEAGAKASAVSLSADEKLAAFGMPDGSLILYDVERRSARTAQIGPPGQAVAALAFLPDKRNLLAWLDDAYAVIDLGDLAVRSKPATGLMMRPGPNQRLWRDGAELVGVCADNPGDAGTNLCRLTLVQDAATEAWSLSGGVLASGPENTISAFDLSSDGAAMASLDQNNYLHVWREPPHAPVHLEYANRFAEPWVALSLAPDRTAVSSVTAGGGVLTLRAGQAPWSRRIDFPEGSRSVAATRSETATLVATEPGEIGSASEKTASGGRSAGLQIAERGMAWTGRDQEVLVIGKGGDLALTYPTRTGDAAPLPIHHGLAQGLVVDSSARRAYVQYDEGARIYALDLDGMRETALPQPLACPDAPLDGAGSALALSPDRRWLAATALGSAVRLYDLTTAAAPRCLPLRREAEGVAFSPDSRRLATIDNGDEISVWDLARLEAPALSFPLARDFERRTPLPFDQTPQSLAWLADGALVAIGHAPSLHSYDLDETVWRRKLDALDIGGR